MIWDQSLPLLLLAGLLGLLFGSFLNVCICRIPKRESVVTGASHCTACGALIRARDLVPVVSFVLLRGRCRACGDKISIRYPVIELANAVLWVLICLRYGWSAQSIIYCAFVSVLLVAAVIDIDTMLVPPALTVTILALGVLCLFVLHDTAYYNRLIGFVAGGLPFLLIAVLSKGGMGGGDIKLMAVCGLVLGWRLILLSLLLAVIAGGIWAAALLLAGRAKKGAELALVPFLSGGMLISLLFGEQMIAWYVTLFFPK